MSPVLLLIIVILLVYTCFYFVTGKPKNTPPGIIRLPIWGSYWMLLWGNYKFPHKTIWHYVEKYKSKIISCYLGSTFTVIVNDYDSIKEVLSRREFDGREVSDVLKIRAFNQKLGIFFNDGVHWQQQRRFSLRNMRDFGFGRRHQTLEENLVEELTVLLDTIDNGPINNSEKTVVNKNLVYFPNILYPVCANMIWSVISGERFKRCDHDEIRELCMNASIFQRGGDTSGGALSMSSWLRYFGNLFGWKNLMDGHNGMKLFLQRYIDQNGDALIVDKSREGFISTYLREMEESKNIEGDEFSIEKLLIISIDFMFPALSAVPSVIVHCLKYMMHYPNIMKQVQAEIDNVVGRGGRGVVGRLPSWDDRKNLPFTEATIREVMRIETLTPLSVGHRCTQNTKLWEYDIPVDTLVITNLAGMHNDPDLWGDPANFRPDRFLNNQGQLGKDYTFPFGFGRRVCGGETFARFIIFEIFSTLVQHYDFSFVEGEPTRLDDVVPGLIVQPKRAWLRLDPRN